MPGPHGGTLDVVGLCTCCEAPTRDSCRLCGCAVCDAHRVPGRAVCLGCAGRTPEE